MKAYRLLAILSEFSGTNHEPSRSERIVAISKNADTLYEIKNLIDGGDGWIQKDTSPYCAAAHRYWTTYDGRDKLDKEFPLTLRDGRIVKVPLYPVGEFYGPGEMTGLYVQEFDYVAPEDFV